MSSVWQSSYSNYWTSWFFHITGHHIIISIMISSDYSCTCIAIYIIYFRLHSPCEKLQCLTPPTPWREIARSVWQETRLHKECQGDLYAIPSPFGDSYKGYTSYENRVIFWGYHGDIMGILLTGNKNDWLDLWPCSRAPRLGHGHNGRRSVICWSTMALWDLRVFSWNFKWWVMPTNI